MLLKLIVILLAVSAAACAAKPYSGEASYAKMLQLWPRQPNQYAYLCPKDARTKFKINWNGVIRCSYVIKDSPSQQDLVEYAPYQMSIGFAAGSPPYFEGLDQDQIDQRLLDGYLPVLESKWRYESLEYDQLVFTRLLEARRVVTGREMAVAFVRMRVRNLSDKPAQAHLWIQLGTDKSPVWRDGTVYDERGRVRLMLKNAGWSDIAYHATFAPPAGDDNYLWTVDAPDLHNMIKCDTNLPGGKSVDLYLRIPYFPVAESKAEVIAGMDFDSELKSLVSEWESDLARGAQTEVPERVLNEVYKSNMVRLSVTPEIDPRTGLHMPKLHPEARYVASSESVPPVVALDLRGYHKEAEEYLESWNRAQGTNRPDGNIQSQEGVFLASPEFEAVRWISKNGQVLWAMCEHYKLTRDRKWLDRVLANLLASCDWINRERSATKVTDANGERSITYGLLPGGQTGDYAAGNFIFTEAFNYLGMSEAAEILSEIDHPRAAEITRQVQDYRSCIRDAVKRATARAIRVRMSDGQLMPWVPNEFHQRGLWVPKAAYGMDRGPEGLGWAQWAGYGDIGPWVLVFAGVFEPKEPEMTWALRFAEEYPLPIRFPGLPEPHTIFKLGASYSQMFYNYQSEAYFRRDEIDKYVETMYSLLAGGLSKKTYVGIEHRVIPNGVWHYSWQDGEWTIFERRTLLKEMGSDLWLLRGIPRAWLEDGKRISVKNAPTYFGPMSFEVTSQVRDSRIEVTIDPPKRNPPPGMKMRLRLRHPGRKHIKGVTLDGKELSTFSGDVITIRYAGESHIRVVARY